MSMTPNWFLPLLLVLTIAESPPKVLIISFDGFRWDYIDVFGLNNFKSFGVSGVRARKVESCFATVTLPNHFSLITGLYEDEHGIVSNQIYDPQTGKVFDMKTADSSEPFWWTQNSKTLPLWTANQLQKPQNCNDDDRRSGVIGWAGEHIPFRGRLPDKKLKLNSIYDFKKRLSTILDWFVDRNEPINFGAIYFDQPDETGHKHGPMSPEMGKTLKRLDALIGFMNDQIYIRGLENDLNVVIVSDHGMAYVDTKNDYVILEDLLASGTYRAYGTGSVMGIFPTDPNLIEPIYRNLSDLLGVRIYRREELAKNHHYSNNERIAPLVLIADVGYLIFRTRRAQQLTTLVGQHGYDQRAGPMHTIFLARGPAFRQGQWIDEMRVVDVYPMVRLALEISNSSIDPRFSHLLRDPSPIGDLGVAKKCLPFLKYLKTNHRSLSLRTAGLLLIAAATILILSRKPRIRDAGSKRDRSTSTMPLLFA